jgi:conjugative transposon TraN protein
MKCKCVFVKVVMLGLLSTKLFAQNENYSFIPPSNLKITCNKTTNLIFPFAVQSVDRGSKDILVQQPKGIENIVQLKADKPNFSQTNLSIITVDGSLYSFTIDYAPQPTQLNVVVKNNNLITSDSSKKQTVKLSSGNNEALFKTIAQKIDASKPVLNKRVSLNKMQLRVRGIYVNNDIVYFRLQVKNKSNISFDIDNVRFSIKDGQESKRTATQEIQLTPVYNYKALNKVQADSIASCIIAFPKFTVPDSKYLLIDVLEKNGSRNLRMVLKAHHLECATTITE